MTRTDRIGKVLEIVYEYYMRTNEPIEAFKLISKVMAIEKVTKQTAIDYVNVARDAGEIRFVGGYAYAPGEREPEINANVGGNAPTMKSMPEMLQDHENRISEIERIIADMRRGFEKGEREK